MTIKKKPRVATNPEITIWEALIPVIVLVSLLAWNVFVYGDDALRGSNQFILLLGGAVAAIIGFKNNIKYKYMISEVADNFNSVTESILILLLVGSLAGTWLISGIIPSMIYYGIQMLNPSIFLPATVIICAVISIATGSSWTTSATVGIALIGIGKALGLPAGVIAGAVLSGAYFGDKLSPLSDTTNLAPAMAGGELFTHIRYMTYTTIPSISIAMVVFVIISISYSGQGSIDTGDLLISIKDSFHITPILFAVPALVIFMITKRTRPLIALLVGALLGAVFALIFQPAVVLSVSGSEVLNTRSAYQGILNALTVSTSVTTSNESLNDLFSAGGMSGMLNTIWLIMCAMVFGGIMDAIGALDRISKTLLSMANSVFGLFASTVVSCLALNVTASDQYLSIVVPGKMFAKAYKNKNLAPENLSRTLEDSGTVTSVLIPWNTCGAYQSQVLGVSTGEYLIYAVFNYVSPIMTLIFAGLNIKIRQLTDSLGGEAELGD